MGCGCPRRTAARTRGAGRSATDELGTSFLRPTLLEIERISGGNPFFALELARALLALPDPPRPLEPLPVPDDLRGLVGARSTGSRRRAISRVARRRSGASDAAVASARGGDAADELIAAGILVQDGGAIHFAHPLMPRPPTRAAAPPSASLHTGGSPRRPPIRGARTPLAAAAEAPDADVAAAVDAASAYARARGATDAAGRLAARAVELTPPAMRPRCTGAA